MLCPESYLWTRIDSDGPPPASRLDHTLCVVNLPIFCESISASAEEHKAKLDAKSDRLVVYPVDTPSSPQLVTVLSPDVVAVGIDKDVSQKAIPSPHTPNPVVVGYQTALMVVCGMDTQGTIFDDCLVFSIAEYL